MSTRATQSLVVRKAATVPAPPIVQGVVRSPGQPLDPGTRALMEPRFGFDFSRVRVHADTEAAAAARAVGAHAYTHGEHIVFGDGRYEPATTEGRKLVGHELAHVVQQSVGRLAAPAAAGRARIETSPLLESEADAAGEQAARGERAPVRGAGPRGGEAQRNAPPAAIQRQPAPATPPERLNNIMMAVPPFFRQGPLTCWASAIAAWRRVKGIGAPTETDRTFINRYHNTRCVGEGDSAGPAPADIEDLFNEQRLFLDLGDQFDAGTFTTDIARRLLIEHGHFILVLNVNGSTFLHAVVVFGFHANTPAADPFDFTYFVMDPMDAVGVPRPGGGPGERQLPPILMEFPVTMAIGRESAVGPAPCSRQRVR